MALGRSHWAGGVRHPVVMVATALVVAAAVGASEDPHGDGPLECQQWCQGQAGRCGRSWRHQGWGDLGGVTHREPWSGTRTIANVLPVGHHPISLMRHRPASFRTVIRARA